MGHLPKSIIGSSLVFYSCVGGKARFLAHMGVGCEAGCGCQRYCGILWLSGSRLYEIGALGSGPQDLEKDGKGVMSPGRVIKVQCQCGQRLFKYYKCARGRLIKCYLDEIRKDYVGIIGAPDGAQPVCPSCGQPLGVVTIVHGRPALKLDQGTVQQVRT